MPKRVAKRNNRAVKKKTRKSEKSSNQKSAEISELSADLPITNCLENNNNWSKEELVETDWSKEKEDSSGLIQLTSESELIEKAESESSDESSECSMTDISIYESADDEEDEEIIRRNNYASDCCRHEIGEYCDCSKSKNFRNLDGEPVAFGKTYHGMF